ncbi:MAG: hypothetical protein HQM11_05005 [SAR324 cluster bacterium]|nr:hypothetical protein [SAR324 cluster bacterium]
MRRVKFWTIDCNKLQDDEFDVFVGDVERFIESRPDRGKLPQNDSEEWLEQFAMEYTNWPERRFQTQDPIDTYLKIDSFSAIS